MTAQPPPERRVALVTGATGAIGRATVRLLLQDGVTVAALGRNRDHLAALERDGAITWGFDLHDDARFQQVAAEVHERLGPVASLFAFAGGNGRPVPTPDETSEHWRQVIEDDLTVTFRTIRTFLPQLMAHEISSIVTMASSAGTRATQASAAYAAAKAGVIGLTRHLAVELAPRGVRVNCLAPSAVENDQIAALSDQHRAGIARALPLGRLGRPDDIAFAAVQLADPRSASTSGVVLELGGPAR